MLNPHFIAGEHKLFGGYESEDIQTISFLVVQIFTAIKIFKQLKFDFFIDIFFLLTRIVFVSKIEKKRVSY